MPEAFRFIHRNLNTLKTSAQTKLVGRIKLSEFFELNEKEFRENISSQETHPLFMKLFSPKVKSERSVAYARPHRLKLSDRMAELKDNTAPAGEAMDIEAFLDKREKASKLIKKIGEDKFKNYFLLNEAGIDRDDIARACGISPKDVGVIIELVDHLAAREEFYAPPAAATGGGMGYCTVAGIEKEADGRHVIVYRQAHLAKGRYSIDYEKIESQKKAGFFTKEELAQLGALLKQLETVNLRKAVIHKLIENVIEFQKEYIENGEKTSLVPLSQRTAAKRLEISPSLVNRAIFGKSLAVRTGAEVPLRDFFPTKKDVVKNLLEKILVSDRKGLNDEILSNIMMDEHGYKVSRHLVQIYRKELGFPPAGQRNK